MELDELKKSYKKSEVRYSSDELKSIFEIRTQGSIESINKKMLIDALLMIIMTLSLITITFTLGLRSKFIISGQIAGFGLILLLHYKLKYFLLNNIDFEKTDISNAIKKVYRTFKVYWIGYQFVIPIITMLSFTTVYEYIDILHHISAILAYPSIGLLGFLVTLFLLKKLYGKEYNKIKELNRTILNQRDNRQTE